MKKTMKIVSVMCCCLMAMAFTSCLGDDDDNDNGGLNKDQIAQCLMSVKGNYTGDLIYLSANPKNLQDTTDSLTIKWNISNDSIMTIHNFPAKVLAQNVTDSIISKALAAAPDQDIRCYIGFVKTSPVQFLANPQSLNYTLYYYSNEHKLQIAFYVNNYSSFGSYDASTNVLQMQLIAAALFIDGKQTNLFRSVPIYFVSTKKE